MLAPLPWNHPVRTTPAVWHPTVSRDGWAVVWFRRRIKLARPVRRTSFWITASERFIAFLDGELMGRGPTRSDPLRWICPEIPVGPLAAGEHELSVCVVHFGELAGMGQMGGPAFLLIHGLGCDTGEGWECREDTTRQPTTPWGVVGTGERIDPNAPAADWVPAKVVCPVMADEWGNVPLAHVLHRDPLPPMDEQPHTLPGLPVHVPAESTTRFVLDRGELTNAYVTLVVTGGRGATVRCTYAEAPLDSTGLKGNRNEIAGKTFTGLQDEFRPDGGKRRQLSPVWFRSFRYVEIEVATRGEPLTLEEFRAAFTGYPLRPAAKFSHYPAIWDVSWRTARLCAHETFFDCPHYEQCQFPGDSVVQAVYHYLVANDDRLARKAIDDLAASRLPDGMLQCRFPSRKLQVIPTFALYWAQLLHDFRRYRGDAGFVRSHLPGVALALDWFERRRRRDGMLGLIEYAPFVDWAPGFACGNAPQDDEGGSALLTLLFAQACEWFPELGRQSLARELKAAVRTGCWDSKRGLLADTPAGRSYSLHGQVLGVLAGLWPQRQAAGILRRALTDPRVNQPGTFYFRYYLAAAFRRTGLRGEFFPLLWRWETMLEGTGLTTWPESDGAKTRSDCHAWSVTPAIEFLQTVLGVEPAPGATGFDRGLFAPTLGPLEAVDGVVPTPHGPVEVALQRRKQGGVEARLTTPIPLRFGRRWLQPGRFELPVDCAAAIRPL